MARTRKPGRITIGSRAVAVAILGEALEQAAADEPNVPYVDLRRVADNLVGMAWDVEYKPTAERLVIILDAGITSSDKMRSTPEDHPQYAASEADQCPYISNGKRCEYGVGHEGDHETT